MSRRYGWSNAHPLLDDMLRRAGERLVRGLERRGILDVLADQRDRAFANVRIGVDVPERDQLGGDFRRERRLERGNGFEELGRSAVRSGRTSGAGKLGGDAVNGFVIAPSMPDDPSRRI